MGRALSTDLYELTMAASYLRRGMTAPATFSLFIRSLPPGWGFFVACGLRSSLEWLRDLRFEEEDLAYLEASHGYPPETLEAFGQLRAGHLSQLCYDTPPHSRVQASMSRGGLSASAALPCEPDPDAGGRA